jgi:hypothetical protein
MTDSYLWGHSFPGKKESVKRYKLQAPVILNSTSTTSTVVEGMAITLLYSTTVCSTQDRRALERSGPHSEFFRASHCCRALRLLEAPKSVVRDKARGEPRESDAEVHEEVIQSPDNTSI